MFEHFLFLLYNNAKEAKRRIQMAVYKKTKKKKKSKMEIMILFTAIIMVLMMVGSIVLSVILPLLG